jgi:lysophospholipid acyltransferase (LPLAT)-like uncharacterized protein
LENSPPLDAPPPDASPSGPSPSGAAHRLAGWRRVALWPAVFLVRWWGRSIRFEISAEDRRNLSWGERPVAFALWHNRLFITPEIVRYFRPHRPMHALVSASRDGAWLEAFFNGLGMRTVRGSSNRLGREAAAALVGVLRSGDDVGITPDGPRGPAYVIKPGALIVARRAQVPVMLFGAEFLCAWRLRSWDGFYLPLPWSRVRLWCEQVLPEELDERDQAAAALEARLRKINPDRS